jgi:hypothetical protein
VNATTPREAVILPWVAAQSPPTYARLEALTGSPDFDRALAALEGAWFRWAFEQTASWPHERVRAVFDHTERLVAEGHSRHDAERFALAACLGALSDEAIERAAIQAEGSDAP